MFEFKIPILFFLIIIGSGCSYLCNCNDSNFSIKPFSNNKEILGIINQYKNLKTKKGHFNGGEWNDELDKWNGKLHNIMIKLGENLGKPDYKCSDIINFLGDPDEIKKDIEEEHLIYYWRGKHDYLYFICKNGFIQKSEWYYSYE